MRISEIFYSIQGEGMLVGVPSIFVRVAGCNLRCEWCDTKYAWDPESGDEMTTSEVVERVCAFGAYYCVLTGGEPLQAEGVAELTEELCNAGQHLTIETNASSAPNGIKCDLASLSPKLGLSGSAREPSIESQLKIVKAWLADYDTQLKFVVRGWDDLGAVDDFVLSLNVDVDLERVFLMPRGSDEAEFAACAPDVAEMCVECGYRFGPRLHLELYGNTAGS